MRELPEPDGYVDGGKTREGYTYSLPYFLEETVLAIQKQAYEDGLRDAAEKIEAYDCWLPTDTTANVIREMLTASQEKK